LEITGAVVSTKVTVTVNDAFAVFVPSDAVQLTGVWPTGKVEPEVGVQLTVGGVPLSSVAATVYVTTAPVPDVVALTGGGGLGVNVGG
jgi:hypothetical protein